MEVKFKIAGGLNLNVEEDRVSRVVRLVTLRGVCYEHTEKDNVGNADGPCPEIKADVLILTKAEARAIASAMMGCAAEL